MEGGGRLISKGGGEEEKEGGRGRGSFSKGRFISKGEGKREQGRLIIISKGNRLIVS